MDNRNQILNEIAEHLDISPSDFKTAQERFTAIGKWLDDGNYKSGSKPDIYLQGSFRLGTVVRPFRNGKDSDFDIDQVCELTERNASPSPRTLKYDIYYRLKENKDYEKMLKDESQRCWTIEYSSPSDRAGFHIDILPSIADQHYQNGEIYITDKQSQKYYWLSSNPKGYYHWFKSKNPFSDQFINEQRTDIFSSNRALYESVSKVPKQLLRSSLQRAIQIMKRHRDVYFEAKDFKPISIIITTICAHLYKQGDIITTIKDFTKYVMKRHNEIIAGKYLLLDHILDYSKGNWLIPNPVDRSNNKNNIENFADKWNQNSELPKAFFNWTYQLDRDIRGFEMSALSDDLSLRIKRFGEGSAYQTILYRNLQKDSNVGSSDFTNQLLDLIHLGIEGKLNWDIIESIAFRNVQYTPESDSRDVARVNYYQTILHQGKKLSDESKRDVRRILNVHGKKANFVFCCNLLLGSATRKMLQECILYPDHGGDVMAWPIVRLASSELFLPAK